MEGPDIDAELIQLSASLWQDLKIGEHLTLEINNIGSAEDRKRYGAALTAFMVAHADELDDDARDRMLFPSPKRPRYHKWIRLSQ